MSHLIKLWCLSHTRVAKAQTSLRLCADSSEPSLPAHTVRTYMKAQANFYASSHIILLPIHVLIMILCKCDTYQSRCQCWSLAVSLNTRAAKAQTRLCLCTETSEPSLYTVRTYMKAQANLYASSHIILLLIHVLIMTAKKIRTSCIIPFCNKPYWVWSQQRLK